MKKLYISLLLVTAAFAIVACNKNEIVDPNDGLRKVSFTVKGEIDPSLTRTYIVESGDTYLAKWSDAANEHLGVIFDNVVSDMNSTTLNAASIENNIATFSGSASITAGNHTIHPFYPATAFNKTYGTGKIGLTLNHVQYPVTGSFDPATDIMIGADKEISVSDAENVLVEKVVFTRPMAVLRLHLVAKNDQAKAYGETVTSVEMEMMGQNPAVTLTGNLSYTPNTDEFSWNTNNSSVKAAFDSNHANEDNVRIETDDDLNSVYLVVNPATISGGSIVFTIETSEHSGINAITRTVNVPASGMEFLAGKVNDIFLTVRDQDVPDVVEETRILVDSFSNVSESGTQPQPSATGASGTGVSSSLAYAYSNEYTNIRFNNNGQSSDNPYLYIQANQYFTISNIIVSEQTWLGFTAKVKNTGTLAIKYKESSSDTWTNGGTISGSSSFTESTVMFCIASTDESIDLQITASSAMIVDDIVLAPGTAPGHNLAVDEATKTLGGAEGATVTIEVTSNYAWEASISSGSGFSLNPSSGGPNGSITVTATNDGTTSEVELGKITISDGVDNVEVTIRQEPNPTVSYKYVKVTSLSDLTAGTYVIVNDNYYLPNVAATNSSPVKNDNTKVTISDNALSSVGDDMTWEFSGNVSAMTIKSTIAGNYYLVNTSTSSNTGIRVNTTSGKTWTISEYSGTAGAFSLKDNTNNRYCASYSSGGDWRSYNTYNHANYSDGGRIYLYKKTASGSTTYNVNLGTIDNGSVTRSVESATAGTSVTLTATAAENYTFSSWNITGITLTDAEKTTNPLTITMPANDITVSANFTNGDETVITINFAETTQRPNNFPTASPGANGLHTYSIAGYDFSFYAPSGNGFYWNHAEGNNQKYLLIGKSGANILFPAIVGQKLTSVKIHTSSNGSQSVKAGIYSSDGQTVIEPAVVLSNRDADYQWSLSGTAINTGYQFRITNDYNAQLTLLQLTYE